MRKAILALALLVAGGGLQAADQDMVLRVGSDTLRLSDSPCVHGGTLAQLQEQWRAKFKKARALINGKDFFACWIGQPDGTVYVMYEDGDHSELPIAMFKPDVGV